VRDEGYNLDRDFGAAGVRTSKTTAGFNYHTDSPSMLAGHTPDIVCLLALQTANRRRVRHHERQHLYTTRFSRRRPEYLDRLYAPYHVDRRAELPPVSRRLARAGPFAHDGRLSSAICGSTSLRATKSLARP